MGRESFLNQIKIKNMFWDSRIDSEFRKVWQILNRFCCKVKSCLGISSQGNPDLVLNQQGNWIKTQSYKVYTALLTQSGGSDPIPLQTGNLTIGVTYLIYDNSPGMDFTNVGAPNNNVGTSFVATGTTPNSWGTLEGLTDIIEYNNGAPVVTVLENTIGNIWFTYDGVGIYSVNSNGLFTTNKTYLPPANLDISLLLNAERFLLSGWTSENILTLNNTDSLFISTNDIGRGYLEIRVYN
jgi:hypothetical protein